MGSAFRLYSKELLPLCLFVCILFVMGVVFGALLVNELTLQQRQDIGQFLNTFFAKYSGVGLGEGAGSAAAAGADSGAAQVWAAFGSHARWLFFIWILGLSIVGVPLILLLDFLKGVLIGFTVGYLAGQWSWKGVLFALASVIPQNMIVVPTIIVCSVAAISFSILLIRSRMIHRTGAVGRPFVSFTMTAALLAFVVFGVSLFEIYVSPELLKWVVPTLLQGV